MDAPASSINGFTGLLLGLLLSGPAGAARPLGPPIEELLADPELIRIASVTALEKTDSQTIRFAVRKRVSGEAPDEVLLRTDAATAATVVVGSRYVVAWSHLRKNRRFREGYETDPDGPAIAKVRGPGTVALFEQTPEISYLFSPGVVGDPAQAERQLDALLEQMGRADPRSRSLVASQLLLRPDLSAKMDQRRAAKLESLLALDELIPQHRDLLLQTALRMDAELQGRWLAETFRKVIIQYGTQYDLSSFVPALVLTAARGLQQTGDAGDVELLSTLLYSNNPGVAKAALAAMDSLDRGAAAAKVEQALRRDWIHTETRRALNRYRDPPEPTRPGS